MEKELQNMGSVFCQMFLPVADLSESFFPDIFVILDRLRQRLALQDFRVHAYDENFLVMRAVKNSYTPAFRCRFLRTPQVIVVHFFGRGLFERDDLAALRIYSAHDM